uniref:Uncharacterized protein n=1 Tax=Zea mays TaxID=4577 RepID=A0A804NRY7_MAIZE
MPSLLSVWRRWCCFLSALRPSLLALLVDRARPARLCALRSIGDLMLSCLLCSSPRRSCSPARTARLCALLVGRALVLALLVSRARLLASTPCGRLGISCSAARPARHLVGRARTTRLCALLVGRALVLALLVSHARLLASAPCSSVVHSCSPCSLVVSDAPALKGPSLLIYCR